MGRARRRLERALAVVTFGPAFLLWRPQRDIFYEGVASAKARPDCLVEKLILRLAAHDWLLLGYRATLLYGVLFVGGPHRNVAAACLSLHLVVLGVAVWLVRRDPSARGRGYAFLYRLGVLASLLGTFFELQWILPAASGAPVDAALYAFDLRVFGFEPAQVLDRFVSPRTTEWFSFFYYGYFILVAVHVLPALFLGKRQRFLVTFGFGFLWLYCVGHVVYTLVPAYGPYAHLSFQHPLEGSLWWPLVKRTVASVDGSARTDVFPSLHTAGPAFLALYSFRHRRFAPFKYTWIPLTFSASQIIIATMFLRWHYLIDICAGLVVACTGVVAGELAFWWDEGRVAAGGGPAWPPFDIRSDHLVELAPNFQLVTASTGQTRNKSPHP